MTFKLLFLVFLAYTALFVIGFGYVYYCKMSPALRKANPNVFITWVPSSRRKLIKQYLALLDNAGERPWFYVLVRHIELLQIIDLIMAVTLVILTLAGSAHH
jgi:hypothetical protein